MNPLSSSEVAKFHYDHSSHNMITGQSLFSTLKNKNRRSKPLKL